MEQSTLQDSELIEHSIDRFGAARETDWLRAHSLANHSSEFLNKGFHLFDIPQEIARNLSGFFAPDKAVELDAGSCSAGYFNVAFNDYIIDTFNRQNTFYGRPDDAAVRALEAFLGSVSDEVEQQLGQCWQVCNARAWAARPGADFGSNTWHMDGFSRYVRKMMIYVNPPSRENGTIEIMTRKGEAILLEHGTAVAVLFDSAVLSHRGVPSPDGPRPVIELTIAPAETTSTAVTFAGQFSRVPLDLAGDIVDTLAQAREEGQARRKRSPVDRFAATLRAKLEAVGKPLKMRFGKQKTNRPRPAVTNLTGCLNIGGGRKFQHRGWVNLDGAPGVANPFPFQFGKGSVFPLPSGSVNVVYSSHCIEHLSDETVDATLAEARRVVAKDGVLVLKIPDFDMIMEQWREKNRDYFYSTWNLDKVAPTWASRDVPDDIDARAAYLFCGFWNRAYGHGFDGTRNPNAPGAFNGPPVQIRDVAEELVSLSSAHEIAARLRQAVEDNEPDHTFNHQNAWGRDELRALLHRHGFQVDTFDEAEIVERYASIPEIEGMRSISTYCVASPIPGA